MGKPLRTLTDIQKALTSVSGHAGLIIKGDDRAIRVAVGDVKKAREAIGLSKELTWRLAGVPLQWEEKDLEALLDAMKWKAVVVLESRRCRRDQTTWMVRAEDPPKYVSYPVTAGSERITIRISSSRPSYAQDSSVPSAEPPIASTWADVLKGKASVRSSSVPAKKWQSERSSANDSKGKGKGKAAKTSVSFEADDVDMTATASRPSALKRPSSLDAGAAKRRASDASAMPPARPSPEPARMSWAASHEQAKTADKMAVMEKQMQTLTDQMAKLMSAVERVGAQAVSATAPVPPVGS